MQFFQLRKTLVSRQILLGMKLLTVFLFLGLMQVSARTNGQNVSISGKNISLEKVFKIIKKQSEYVFFYDVDLLKKANPVTIDVTNQPVETVLKQVFHDQPFTWSVQNKTITVVSKPRAISLFDSLKGDADMPVTIEVQGVVTDENGKPLEGVSVVIKGTNMGTSTNSSGFFSLKEVSENAILIFSMVGYFMNEVEVKSRTNINVRLAISFEQQQEIVIANTGYQKISRERSTGTFSKPKMETFKNRTNSLNILDRMDGLVPGLTLNKGGQGDYFPISIRGLTTVNGSSSPLFVVDGMVVESLSGINPIDIKDITILKDATAASVWGARAANGVIVLTTKDASGDGFKFNYDVFYTFQGKPKIDVFPMLRGEDYIKAIKEIYNTPGYISAGKTDWATINTPDLIKGENPVAPHDYFFYGKSELIPDFYKNKTLEDLALMDNLAQMKELWYRSGLMGNHTLSLSANNMKYGIYASIGFTENYSSSPGSSDDSYSLNIRQDFRPLNRLKIYIITNAVYRNLKEKSTISPDGRFIPYASFKDEHGNGLDMSWLFRTDSLRRVYENQSEGISDLGKLNLSYYPSLELNYGETGANTLKSRFLSGINIDLFRGLSFEGLYGGSLENTENHQFDDVRSYFNQLEIGKMTIATPVVKNYLPTTGGKRSLFSTITKEWSIRNQLIYDKNWKDRYHQLTILGGMEVQQHYNSSVRSTVRGYDKSMLTYKSIDYVTTSAGIPNSIINTSGTYKINDQYIESINDTRFISYYANGAYTFQKKYTLNASTRYDESNLFGKDVSAQARPVWSVGGSWKVSDESFFSNLKWIDRLLLRVTYGITGNSPLPGTGSSYDIIGQGFAWGVPSGLINANTIVTPGNTNLSWEKTNNFNVGLSFSILKSRINAEFDYYFKHTTNLLGNVPENPFTGFDFVFGNAGIIDNKGIEVSLTSINIDNKGFKWHSNLNLAYNKGKVVSLYNSLTASDAASLIKPLTSAFYAPVRLGLRTGFQPFTLFAYRFAGLNDQGDPMIYLADGSITSNPGVPQVSDLVDMGTVQPKVSG
ncbi:MAG: SusC/RagA family TonB-linked outer membrane protein, partial [Chitinophagaceae bacterium]|nr:SusC/RagA family TonB-linked outer membrane protein [Chitinophagaceae bacterium]